MTTKTAVRQHDFGGYATVANKRCSDGRIIAPGAFEHMDKVTVPLVWQHGHDEPAKVLGHAVLENRPNGVYAYGFFNTTDAGKNSSLLVQHGDINSLSIYANGLVEKNKLVQHGNIKEVSLVLAGANPDARIDYVRIAHSDGEITTLDDEAIIFSGQSLEHFDNSADDIEHAKTFQDVWDSMTDEQRGLVEFMVAEALTTEPDASHSDEDDEDDAKLEHKEKDTQMVQRRVFENNGDGTALAHVDRPNGDILTHSDIPTEAVRAIVKTMTKGTTWREAFLAHADEYGITNIEALFPDARTVTQRPEYLTRRMEWVDRVLNGTQKLPFSKIKSWSADLRHEEARAKGYIKGSVKKEQFFAIASRETGPQTIYKKQKLDRDDIIDITAFDVVAWLWVEMYFMLREEVARAILVGDGREVDDPDKVRVDRIRPIVHDDEFYTDIINVPVNVGSEALVEAVLRGRDRYLGNSPTAFMTNAVMTDMLLAKDNLGRRLYRTKSELAAELNVVDIVEVPIMEGVTRNGGTVLMVIVNLGDYGVGSTAGGEITKFDDFDIDLNQYKYLIEGRASGALLSHKKAQIVIRGTGTLATATTPTFNSTTGVVTIPTVTGVTYKNQLTDATLSSGAQTALAEGATLSVKAVANSGYYFAHNTDNDWSFTRPPA